MTTFRPDIPPTVLQPSAASGPCPFCEREDADCFLVTPEVRAFWDGYPVSPGHALVVPRRHVSDWFAATPAEQAALVRAVEAVRARIEERHRPDGYNLGVNVGAAAGQTVPHLHLHVIPRYHGDVPDPRGGVRFVVPHAANYLASPTRAGAPHDRPLVRGADDPLLQHLVAHIAQATEVDLAIAFVMARGVELLEEHLRDVLARGGRVRVLTGEYLGVTEPEALHRLLDLGPGLELRVFRSGAQSFHLKGYICADAAGHGTAFVGSSNLSRMALREGVEWNYRVTTSRDGHGFRDVRSAFDSLFGDERAAPVDVDWVREYAERRRPPAPGDSGVQPDPLAPVQPHDVQREALAALHATRARGNRAGLVVLATGLGKTWLSAFDVEQAGARRVLFVAHREEILDQAMRTFRRIRPRAVLGRYTGTERTLDADVTFASIQTIGRQRHLDRFAADHFDYVIVDEFHHAAASTYRRLLDHFTPAFLLGLTATPERMDGADLLALCGENLVFRCDLAEGIRRGLLSPFDYYGVPDEVDYSNIPWRNGRFDETELTNRLAIASRADNALDELQRRGGERTIAFCVSQRHADYMRAHFARAGKRVAAVHSGAHSDPRAPSLERLQRGELDVLFAVDMFNEGVDIPDVDTVLMLRPTESPVLFLQQFGRGLRFRPGKRLRVIDYIGNHRSFLLKPRTLFQLEAGSAQVAYALQLLDEGRIAELLPPGCSVTYELEAKDILRGLIGDTGRDRLVEAYRELRERHDVRPTASEIHEEGFNPRATRPGYGSWLQFVRAMGDLAGTADQAEVRLRPFLTALESTPMTRSFKMVVLLAMLAEGQFPGAVPVERLAARVRTIVRRSALLRGEFGDALEQDDELVSLLERNPIAAWVGGRGTGDEAYFAYEGRVLRSTVTLEAALHESAAELVRELAEWRLAEYLRRLNPSGALRIRCRVSHANGRPILSLPSRDRVPGVPEGWVDVLADGEPLQAKFAKVAVNVVHRPDEETNVLPDLLRRWFGPNAGLPGTAHEVVFERTGAAYTLAPVGAEVIETGPRHGAVYQRAEVPKLFGFEFRGFDAQSGVVERPNLTLLFVTLDKEGQPREHQYEDRFLAPGEFQWQSQNRTSRASAAGQRLAEHAAREIAVQLFVRRAKKVNGRTEPFTYCGELAFERWEGDKPITVWWRLKTPLTEEQLARLQPRIGAKGKAPARGA